MESLPAHRLSRLIVVLLLSLVLTACGADNGEEEPTATSAPEGAQPTVAVEEAESPVATPGEVSSASSPTNIDMSGVPADMTPNAGATAASTPNVVTPAVDGTPERAASRPATPSASPVANETTPAAGEGTGASTPDVTGTDESVTEGNVAVGDGTTGAVIAGTPAASPVVAAASPGASPVAASPVAAVTVTGCEVPTVPPFSGGPTIYVLTSDVNFRTGPGADCALALETPLGEFQPVEVIGGPVVRQDDGSEWVQIRALDIEGWVAFEFLQPAQ